MLDGNSGRAWHDDDVRSAVLKAKFLIEQPVGQGVRAWKEKTRQTDNDLEFDLPSS